MKRVLIIEDNEDVRENTADILELARYEVATAENGISGIAKTRAFKPDIIICDIMMPVMDGYEVLSNLSTTPETAGIPFIFLTAKTEKTDIRKGMNLGADDYLTKPFEESELLNALESRLKKRDFLRKEYAKTPEGVSKFINEVSDYLDYDRISRDYYATDFKKKDLLFMEGDAAHHLFYIRKGLVKTHRSTEAGKELVTGLHGPGNFIGQLSLLNPEGTWLETATVLEDAEIYSIPKKDFLHLLYDHREVAHKFITLISNDLIEVQDQLVNMAYATVRQRLAKALLHLLKQGFIQEGEHQGIDIPREDLAGMVGTATETVIRALSELREEGIIDMGKARRIIVVDRQALESISEMG